MTKERDPLLDCPTALRAYQQALQNFVKELCTGLTAQDSKALAMSFREHDGLIVFSDCSGGLYFEVKVTFKQLLEYDELMKLIGALAEKNGPSEKVRGG